ncbi:hypothetical protein [Paraburkholderia sp.]|uniref:hypothetical protein n=1 Tax=Paraburkholderia sp. TaxID=1926495 RepID=UPI0039E60738
MKKRREFQGTRSESRDVNEFFGKNPYKSNVDDKPRRTPKDRNTGTSARKRLEGKVIG